LASSSHDDGVRSQALSRGNDYFRRITPSNLTLDIGYACVSRPSLGVLQDFI
jgi:hypothetical protein